MGSLKHLSDNDKGFGNIKAAAGNVLTALGGMVSGGSGGGNDSSATNSNETAVGFTSFKQELNA